jgi:hypothetical protein
MTEKLIRLAFEDNENPSFLYLAEQHSLDHHVFSMSSDVILSASTAIAKKYSKITNIKIDKNLVHAFFDLLLCLSTDNFSNQNEEIFTAIMDGLHFKYFEQPSQNIITSSTELTAKPENCFIQSMLNLDTESFTSMVATFIFYATNNKVPNSTQNLETAKTVVNLTNKIIPVLTAKLKEVKG